MTNDHMSGSHIINEHYLNVTNWNDQFSVRTVPTNHADSILNGVTFILYLLNKSYPFSHFVDPTSFRVAPFWKYGVEAVVIEDLKSASSCQFFMKERDIYRYLICVS